MRVPLRESRRSARRRLGGGTASFLAVLAGACAARLVTSRARPDASLESVQYWCADRDADRVVGLDRALLVRSVVTVKSPVRIAPAPSGGFWVVSDADGREGGAATVQRLDATGELREAWPVSEIADLAADGAGAVAWIERGDGQSVLWCASRDVPWQRVAVAGARCVAARGRRVVLGTDHGEVLLVVLGRRTLAPRGRLQLEQSIRQIAAGPAGGWWVVTDAPALTRVDADLRRVWTRPLPAPGTIVTDGEGEWVWWIERRGRRAQRLSPAGLSHSVDSPLIGLGRGLADAERCIVPVPGALLSWDHRGSWGDFQGAFDFAVELVRAR